MELRHDPAAPEGSGDVVVDGDDVFGVVRSQLDGVVADVALDVVDLVDAASASALLDCVIESLEPHAVWTVRLQCSDELVREHARHVGFAGPLRGVLERPRRSELAPPVGDTTPDIGEIAAAVHELSAQVSVRPRGGPWRGFELRAERDGARGPSGSGANGSTVRVRLPRRVDLMAEPIAAAIDTVFAVKARFGRAASGITKMSFDHGGEALTTGNIAGLAEGAAGVVVLTPNFVATQLMGEARQRWREQGRAPRVASAQVAPCRVVDDVVAHECWHYLDAEVRSSGRAYVEFNAALGDALGVESLEHALRGRERGAPAEWQAAHARLVRDVSNYAGTNPREATAEMFSIWWRGDRGSPVVARFGELVTQHFPE